MSSSDPPPPAEPNGPGSAPGAPPPAPSAPPPAPSAPPPAPSAPPPAPSAPPPAPSAPVPGPSTPAPAPGALSPPPGTLTPVPGGEQPVTEEIKSLYPPYPKYDAPPAMSVADTIMAGRVLRAKDKALCHDAPIGPVPRPARPRRPKVTDIPMSRREKHEHTCCLRKHGAVLTDRLEYMAKPARRAIIYLWRDHADTLPPETIARLRTMLDADEPFKPDKAYDYFVNMRKTRRATKKAKINQFEADMKSICENKRYDWVRNATVGFARGVQQRLGRPGRYVLADGMLRLSNIILSDLCGYMRMRTPCRQTQMPKGRFMIEMADKVAVWIDEILAESDDRMLMMDFDEDVEEPPAGKKPPEPPAGAKDGKGGKLKAGTKAPEPKAPEPKAPEPKAPEPKAPELKLGEPKLGEAKSEEAKWVDAEAGHVPPGAVVGGKTSSGEPVYVARAEHEKSLIPGNLVPSSGAAHVASGGGQQAIPKYQVLVGGSGRWQHASGPDVPADALPGGHSGTGEVLYVGRANHEGDVIVGMVSKSLGSLLIAFGGKEVAIKDYEILMK